MPVPAPGNRVTVEWTHRHLINQIRCQVRSGAPSRDVPACYGASQAAYGLLRHWQGDVPGRTPARRRGNDDDPYPQCPAGAVVPGPAPDKTCSSRAIRACLRRD